MANPASRGFTWHRVVRKTSHELRLQNGHDRNLAGAAASADQPVAEFDADAGRGDSQRSNNGHAWKGLGGKQRSGMFDNVPVQTMSGDGSYTAVLVVPTGIGAAIGGYAGDALPVAR